ncbi:MAG: endonuclease [Bacteroidales bacterium]|nr:endonuclease [Bacteroidales bacterium]
MKKIQKLYSLLLLFTMSLSVLAQGPNNTGTYYSNADGKKGAALKTALYNIIKSPNVVSYDGLISAYEQTDTRPDGCVRDWYSNVTNYRHGKDTGGYKKEGDSYNREHSVPQSWFSKASPMKSDIVHVVPTDGYVNNRRSSYPLAEVGSVTWQSANGYCKLGSCKTPGYTGTVFEPNDEIKGDIARIYFYMVTCYEDRATSWGHVFSNNKAKGFDDWYIAMLLRWSNDDPIDEVELARNEAVYRVQGNRNPYVDYPHLEDYVFGSKKEEAFSYDNYASGGSLVPVIDQPVFSPAGGKYKNQVEVTISTNTEGAAIYYTLGDEEVTPESTLYEGPFILTESAMVKAIAVLDTLCSIPAVVNYVITQDSNDDNGGQGGEITLKEVDVQLNNDFFNCNYSGSINATDTEDLVGTDENVTITYSLGKNGSNRFCNKNHIRIYPHNVLRISVQEGQMTQLEFELAESTTKTLTASTGKINDFKWTGNSKSVEFSFNSTTGHIRLASVNVQIVSMPSGIQELNAQTEEEATMWNLAGQRITSPRSGLYIRNGKKYFVK